MSAPWRRGWAAASVAAVLVVAGPVSLAAAHDELTGAEPADGATVDVAPEQVRLEFSGQIAPVGSFVTVTGPLGAVTDGSPEVDGQAVVQPLIDDAPPGEYAVVWRVTSQDGHPISGEFDYTVPSAGIEAQNDQAPATASTDAAPSSEASSADSSEATPEDSASSSSPAPEVDAATQAPDRAANTAAAPAQGDNAAGSGTSVWVWVVVSLALVTLGGLGAVVLRRR